MAFFEEAKRELPWDGVELYKRRGFRGLETIKEYVPDEGWMKKLVDETGVGK